MRISDMADTMMQVIELELIDIHGTEADESDV